MTIKKAIKMVTRHNGRTVYRVPFVVRLNDSQQCAEVGHIEGEILAYSAAEAANALRHEYRHRPETEVYTYGPRGGEHYRYIGWESAIAAMIWESADNTQLGLQLGD